MTDTAPAQVAPAIPFSVASRINQRFAFEFTAALGAAVVTPAGIPFQLPAVGYVKSLRLEFTTTHSGGSPSFTADAPWNFISNVALKNSAGQQIIPASNGFSLYCMNKYGGVNTGMASGVGQAADPRYGRQFSAVAATGTHFFLDIPFEFDASTGLGAIPALASNRSYLIELSFNTIAGVFGVTTPPTTVNITVNASIVYWDTPSAMTEGGVSQGTEPAGMNLDADVTTTAFWLSEFPPVAPGAQTPRSNNVGNTIRTLILILRTSAGARTAADWPAIFTLLVNNYPQLRFKLTEWQDAMTRWYQYNAAAFDAAGGLDTGVYVIPFHLLAGGTTSDPSNSRAQLLPTEDSTFIQFQMNDIGATGAQLQVLTQAIASPDLRNIFSK